LESAHAGDDCHLPLQTFFHTNRAAIKEPGTILQFLSGMEFRLGRRV
jgi:hypothetical protein